jgi:FAD/FMN-containing dehydrogenase
LVCDNIIGYEIVLSSGSIIYATQTSHGDLWRALKGGSSNFGIVTRFDIRTFPQGPFYGGVIVCPITTLDAQLQGFIDLLTKYDPYAAVIVSIRWNKEKDSSILCNLEYTKSRL